MNKRERGLYGLLSVATNSERFYQGAAPWQCDRQVRKTTLGNEHDFSSSAGIENLFVGARRFGEGQFFSDYGTERAVFEAGHKASVDFSFFHGSDGPKREAPSGGATRHQVSRVNADFAAIADDDHTTIRGEKFQVRREIYVRAHFENDVHATAASGLHNFFPITGLAVIENLMCSFAPDEIDALLRAGSAEHCEAHGARHLYCCTADSAARSVHNHRFCSRRFRLLINRMVRSPVGDPHACTLAKTAFFRQGVYLLCQRDSVLRVRARYGLRWLLAVALLHFPCAITNPFGR